MRFLRQDYGAAGEALETALRLDPADPEALHHLYLSELARGRWAEAEAALTALAAEGGSYAERALQQLDELAEA